MTVNVEYVKAPYYDHDPDYRPEHKGKQQQAYDVRVNGDLVGRIRQTVVSTSRSPRTSRIRWGIGSHLEWSWDRSHTAGPNLNGRMSNSPGLYGKTRREAVADMLGYGRAEVVS